MIKGSCLCGDIQWSIKDPSPVMSHCHCSMCRKVHGAAFGTYMVLPAENFNWVVGEDLSVRYKADPASGIHRNFCPRCGSVTPDAYNDRTQVSLAAGCLDDDPGVRPNAHIFVGSVAPWHDITDDLPQHEFYGGGFEAPVVERPLYEAATGDAVRGSCVCGAVVFSVTERLAPVYHCHCLRCRKARAAAHSTDGFVSASGVEFSQGEDQLVSFKVPEATYYTQVFCKHCGSKMPRRDESRDLCVVPLGALDQDPGVKPSHHIYCDFKAPWVELSDGLPAYGVEATT